MVHQFDTVIVGSGALTTSYLRMLRGHVNDTPIVVVDVTRGVIEQDMGLKLGKLDVRMRYAPIDPEWVQ